MIDIRRWGSAVVLSMLLLAGSARAAPEVGWWWNPNESGRGFFVESQNGIMYLAGYFYEADGRATWLVSGGPNADPYTYQGRLLSYSGGQTLLGDYKPPATPLDAGPVAISFSDDTHGTIVWPGGTIPIVRQRFGIESGASAVDNGWWWNEAESGRGYTIEVQGDKVFVVAFMYDAAGNPVWYYSAGTMSTPTTYSGPWLQFAGGQTLTGAYRPPGVPVVVGQLGIEFTAADQATLTFVDTPAVTAPPGNHLKQFKTFQIGRQFKKVKAPRPERWKASFVIVDSLVNILKPASGVGQNQIITWKWSANDVLLEIDETVSTPMEGTFYPERGAVVAEPTYFQNTTDGKQQCDSKPGQNWVEALRGDSIVLVISDRDESFGYFKLKMATPDVLLNCVISGKPVNSTMPLPIDLYFQLPRQPLDAGVVRGKMAEKVILDSVNGPYSSKRTISGSWTFVPVP